MRDANGKFIPGTSGNPRGRPRQSITAALREIVDPREVAQFLADTMRNPAGKMPERMAAAFQIFDRFEGRALTRAEVDVTARQADWTDDLSDEQLDELLARETQVLSEMGRGLALSAGDLSYGDEPDALAELVDVAGSPARAPSAAAQPAETRRTGSEP